MANTAVIGMQWGDEGKGKVVDMLAKEHDVIVRTGGGANAGHTVVDEKGNKYVLHLIPSGIIQNKLCIIGNGVVANLDRLVDEIDDLSGKGISVTNQNFLVSDRAQVVTPYNLLLDIAEEIAKSRQNGGSIGTTMQGIGSAYEFKAARIGLRMQDVTGASTSELEEKLGYIGERATAFAKALGVTTKDILKAMDKNDQTKTMTRGFRQYYDNKKYVNRKAVQKRMLEHRDNFGALVADTGFFIDNAAKAGKRIMFEGAQGTLLDIDHGTYPYVTSSNTTIGGICTGSGVWVPIEHRLGILKAYTTRVGNGPFPTEMTGEVGKRIQVLGKEYGATTGRARRVGWLDLVIAKYAIRVSGINEIALTKLDVLDSEDEILICKGYDFGTMRTDNFPVDERVLTFTQPAYHKMRGWKSDTSKARKFCDLPPEARDYIEFIEGMLDTKIKYVSIGEGRDQVIVR
jgi:adenylosuccinate synthase